MKKKTIPWNGLGQRAVSKCEGSPTFQALLSPCNVGETPHLGTAVCWGTLNWILSPRKLQDLCKKVSRFNYYYATRFSTFFVISGFRLEKDVSQLVPLVCESYSCQNLTKLEFSRQIFRQNSQIQNFMKIYPVGDELFHADRQTDLTKLIVALRSFSNVSKKRQCSHDH
jgi:hypothetical protein